ncbi:MAG: ribosome small subunit-dependent GTPase A [Spirochaetota bacterium]
MIPDSLKKQTALESPQDWIGQVLWGANNIFQVRCSDGQQRRCRLRGKTLRQQSSEHNPLVCGDFVLFEPVGEAEGLIYQRVERRNALQRRNLKRGEPQAFAANIDGVVLLVSWLEPSLREAFLDRLLVAAQRSGCPILVLLNKIDCVKTFADLRCLWQFLSQYRKLGWELWPISMKGFAAADAQPPLGLRRRFEQTLVRAWIRCVYLWRVPLRLRKLYQDLGGKLYVVLGASGVGKSSLCNYLFPKQSQEVQSISQKWQRGVHTTTLARTLTRDDKGCCHRLIDTPGMRNFLPEIAVDELPQLQDYYPDLAGLSPICAYSGCRHLSEPDCAVRDAASYGLISERRYLSYRNLYIDLESSLADMPEYQTQGKDWRKKEERSGKEGRGKGKAQAKEGKSKNKRKKLQLHCDEKGQWEFRD